MNDTERIDWLIMADVTILSRPGKGGGFTVVVQEPQSRIAVEDDNLRLAIDAAYKLTIR